MSPLPADGANSEGTLRAFAILGAVFAYLAIAAPDATASAGTPSFNCAKASTPTEKAICDRWSGAAMADRMLADLVKEAASAPGADTAAIKAGQKAFLATRDACVDDTDCIVDAYLDRIAALQPGGRFAGRFSFDGGEDTDGLVVVEGKGGRTGLWLLTTNGQFSCGFDTLAARRRGDAIVIEQPEDDCQATFAIGPGGDSLDLTSECRSACGMNGYMDGGYTRVK